MNRSKKKNYIDKIDLVTYISEVVVGIVITCVSCFLLPANALMVGLLCLIIVFSNNILYFGLKKNYEEESTIVRQEIITLSDKIAIEKTMRTYSEIPEELKPFARNHLETFNASIIKLKDEQRTGELDTANYYNYLTNYVRSTKKGDNIWALSSFLPSEWDETNQYEAVLMDEFLKADQRGVMTNRLYIFNNEKLFIANKKEPNSFCTLNQLLPYIKKDKYINTNSYAMGQSTYDNLTSHQKKLLGLGFCAFDFEDGKTVLVRDVCADLGNIQEIRGEILFNDNIIKGIKDIFNIFSKELLSLNSFIFKHINDEAKDFLVKSNVNIVLLQPET